jgi:hypothetical protein
VDRGAGFGRAAPQLHSIALPVEEGQGQLSVLADLANETDGGEDVTVEGFPGEPEDEDSDLGTILGGIGIALGLIALLVALTRKPAA